MNHSTSILRMSPICFGPVKNFTGLFSAASGVFLIRSTNALCSFSKVEMTSWSEAGAGGILFKSIAPSSACALAFSSITKFHARSFALLLLACGLMSAFWGGNALRTLIVVGNSRSSTFRNCSFSVMAPPWSSALRFARRAALVEELRGDGLSGEPGSPSQRQVYTTLSGRSHLTTGPHRLSASPFGEGERGGTRIRVRSLPAPRWSARLYLILYHFPWPERDYQDTARRTHRRVARPPVPRCAAAGGSGDGGRPRLPGFRDGPGDHAAHLLS